MKAKTLNRRDFFSPSRFIDTRLVTVRIAAFIAHEGKSNLAIAFFDFPV
jgi:hypothetical protein